MRPGDYYVQPILSVFFCEPIQFKCHGYLGNIKKEKCGLVDVHIRYTLPVCQGQRSSSQLGEGLWLNESMLKAECNDKMGERKDGQ